MSKFQVGDEVTISEEYRILSKYVGSIGKVDYVYPDQSSPRYIVKFTDDEHMSFDETYLEAVTDRTDTDAPARLPEYQPTDTDIREAVAQTIPASPPAPESGAGENVWSVDSERQNLAAYLLMQFGYTWNDNNSCATNVRLAIANLQRQLAQARADKAATLEYINQLFDEESRFNRANQPRFVTETLNAASALLEDGEPATPPAVTVASLTSLEKSVMQFVGGIAGYIMPTVDDGEIQSLISKGILTKSKHEGQFIFTPLGEQIYDDWRNERISPPAVDPDVAALVAACEQVVSLAPLTEPIWADMTTIPNNAVQIAEAGKYAREQAWWQAATILKAALAKGAGVR